MNPLPMPSLSLRYAIHRFFTRFSQFFSLDHSNADQRLYQQIILHSPSSMVLVDAQQPDMPIVMVNATFERITGYREKEVIGRNCRFLHGEDREQPGINTLRNAIARGETCSVTLRNYRKDGTLFWNELRIAPITDRAGNITYFVAVQNDVTESKQSELALADVERRYKQIFDNNRAIKLIIDPDTGAITDANSAAVDFYGYSREDLKKMRIQDINILPAAEVFAEMQRARSLERAHFEFRHRLASGEIRDVEVYSSPIDTTDKRLLYSIVVDVTQKREAEARRERLLELLRFLNRTGLELLTLTDEDDVYTYIGTQLQRLLKNVVILINLHSEERGMMMIQGIYGLGETQLGRVMKYLGYQVVGRQYTLDPVVTPLFRRGELVQFDGGLEKLAERVVPKAISAQLAKLFNIGQIYLIGLQRDAEMYAGLQLYMRGEATIEHPEIIETFVQQASIVLQRLHAIKSLRESELRYRALFQQSNDAVFILGLAGEHLHVNQRGADMLGYTAEEIIAMANVSLVAEEEITSSAYVLERLLKGERIPPYERVFIRSDGNRVTTEVNVEIVYDDAGNPLHLQSIVRDITRRKQMEASNLAFLQDMKALQQIHLKLTEVKDLDELFRQMVLLPQQHLGAERIGLFIIDTVTDQLRGTYGTDPDGNTIDESGYFEAIDDKHWTHEILAAHNRTKLWQNAPLYYYKEQVGLGWKIATTLWNGQRAIGFLVCDNLITRRAPRPYEVELISLLGSTYGHLVERKQTEDALRKSEAQQRVMIEAMPDVIFRNASDGTFLDYHTPDPNLLFEPPESFLGRRLTEVLPPEQAKIHMANIQRAITQQEMVMHSYELKLAGQKRRFEMRMVPLGPDEVLAITRDVTQLWQAQEALAYSEKRLRSILDNMQAIVWSLQLPDYQLDYVNSSIEGITGRPVSAFYQDPELWLQIVHPDDLQHLRRDATRILKSGTGDYELRIYKPDGELRWLLMRLWTVNNQNNRAIRIEGVASDITERKLAQEREFALALERERMRLLTIFIQNAAHEFRTPLSIISFSAHLMSRIDNPERRAGKAEQIDRQVQRITRLVDMLLTMAWLESGQPMSQIEVDIIDVIDKTCTEAIAVYGENPSLHLEYRFDRSNHQLLVMGDLHYLADALWQLLDNAYRFTPLDGMIQVIVSIERRHIWIDIQDSGPGIPEDILPRIFETFWRKDEAHSTPGFGLGLPITRRIIHQHQGHIEVSSNVNEGTRVRVILPMV